MRIKINYKGKEVYVECKVCKGVFKFIGLMFKRNSKPLLFNISDKRVSLHSLFCKPFIVIWLNEKNEVVDYKIIKTLQFNIKSKKNFSKILEIPINNKYKKIINLFGKKKSLNT